MLGIQTIDVYFFIFSIPTGERRILWLKALNLPQDLPQYTYVCKNHFRLSDFIIYRDRTVLNKNAIPLLYPEYDDHTNSSTITATSDIHAEDLIYQ